MDDKKLAELISRRYRSGVNYKQSRGLYDEWAEYERFWNGEHWPQVTQKTRNMPRPKTNIFAQIIEQKIAGLVYELPELYFEPVEQSSDSRVTNSDITGADIDAAELLSSVAKYQAERLGFHELLELATRSAALFGTGIMFFPWDNSIVGGTPGVSAYIGDIAGYEIDPADFFPGDPSNPDIQTQPWLILAERRPLADVKEFYREYAPEVVDLLQPEAKRSDTQIYDHQRIEQSETDYVDVIHCWEKKREKVERKITIETEGIHVEEKTLFYETTLNYVVTCQGHLLRHEEELYKHGLYPFVAFQWYPKRKSFWGKPESADLIDNQKEINRLSGVALLGAYSTGIPDIRYKPEWVDKNDLIKGPGGRLIRDNGTGNWNVDYMNPPSAAAHIPQLRESLMAGLREVSGVHEAWTGKAPSSELNASAIIALQEAAGVRIRGIQRRLYRAIREVGLLWLAHWKEFYTEQRLIRIVGNDNKVGFVWFRGTDYKDMQFDARVQAGIASPFSRTLMMANLDKLLQLQLITPDEYLEMLPTDVMPQAKRILQKRQQKKEQGLAMVQEALGAPGAGLQGANLGLQPLPIGGGFNAVAQKP